MSLTRYLATVVTIASCMYSVFGTSAFDDSPGALARRDDVINFTENMLLENCSTSLNDIKVAIKDSERLAQAAYAYPVTGKVAMLPAFQDQI